MFHVFGGQGCKLDEARNFRIHRANPHERNVCAAGNIENLFDRSHGLQRLTMLPAVYKSWRMELVRLGAQPFSQMSSQIVHIVVISPWTAPMSGTTSTW